MLKIIATMTDLADAAHIGGDPIKTSVIIEIPTKSIPDKLKRYLETDQKWSTLSFSLLVENF